MVEELKFIADKTRTAYDLAAERYEDLFADELREKPFVRALLDAFAERLPRPALVLDAGCGPCGHVARYLAGKELRITGADLSARCVSLARRNNPGLTFQQADIAALPYRDEQFDGVVSFYSVIDTPRLYVQRLFDEMARVTRRGGALLVVVKAGLTEGWTHDLLGLEADIYFTFFSEDEIGRHLERAGCQVENIERREQYTFEIASDRIYAVARRRS